MVLNFMEVILSCDIIEVYIFTSRHYCELLLCLDINIYTSY